MPSPICISLKVSKEIQIYLNNIVNHDIKQPLNCNYHVSLFQCYVNSYSKAKNFSK